MFLLVPKLPQDGAKKNKRMHDMTLPPGIVQIPYNQLRYRAVVLKLFQEEAPLRRVNYFGPPPPKENS